MSAAKHTPGPWWVEGQRLKDGDPFCVRSARGPIVDTDTSRERSGPHDGRDAMRALGEELRANARLIAATPALLEACEWIVEALKQPGDPAAILALGAARCRTAIAAARGES